MTIAEKLKLMKAIKKINQERVKQFIKKEGNRDV